MTGISANYKLAAERLCRISQSRGLDKKRQKKLILITLFDIRAGMLKLLRRER